MCQICTRGDGSKRGCFNTLANQHDPPHRRAAGRGERHGSAKLTEQRVREVRRLKAESMAHKAIARRLGVGTATVFDIVYGRTWVWLTS